LIEVFETLDSTNLEAKRRIAAGEAGPAWLLALLQNAGVGRRGRAWEQAAGDFAGTLYFYPDVRPENFGQISFVAALAAAAAIEALTPAAKLSFKWPNDILLNGGKLAGILLEQVSHQRRRALIIGIGVNIVSKPTGFDYPAARLLDLPDGAAPAPDLLAAMIDARFWTLFDLWREEGFGPIRRAWLDRAMRLGEKIVVRLPREEISGVFGDIDENGALVLCNADGKRIISAGEVFFG